MILFVSCINLPVDLDSRNNFVISLISLTVWTLVGDTFTLSWSNDTIQTRLFGLECSLGSVTIRLSCRTPRLIGVVFLILLVVEDWLRCKLVRQTALPFAVRIGSSGTDCCSS